MHRLGLEMLKRNKSALGEEGANSETETYLTVFKLVSKNKEEVEHRKKKAIEVKPEL